MSTLCETLTPQPGRISLWLFNPFHMLAGFPALAIGLGLIVVSGLLASLTNSHFDGVLDFHTGRSSPLWLPVAEGLIDWLAMGILLWMGGLLVSKSHIRPVDVFGTQALARAPYLLAACAVFLPGFKEGCQFLLAVITGQTSTAIGAFAWLAFAFAIIISIVMVVWMVFLIYRGFTVACNVWGGKAIAVFIPALIVAEIISKVLIVMIIFAL